MPDGWEAHGAFDARITNLETLLAEVRGDVKRLLEFRASIITVVTIVSLLTSSVMSAAVTAFFVWKAGP